MRKTFLSLASLLALVLSSCTYWPPTSTPAAGGLPEQTVTPAPIASEMPKATIVPTRIPPPPLTYDPRWGYGGLLASPTPTPPRPRFITAEEYAKERPPRPPSQPGPKPDWVINDEGVVAVVGFPPAAMVVDGDGNIYITGASRSLTTDYDYVTIKYDSKGRRLWTATYNGPENGSDRSVAVVVDREGNVYVTGVSWGAEMSLTGGDYATIKYDKNGERLWVARYDNNYLYDSPNAIVVDEKGNVYVTGASTQSSLERPAAPQYLTIKYDNNGNRLWVARAEAASVAFGGIFPSYMALDNVGNVYLAATVWQTRGRDYLLIKYDTNGKQLWKATYNGPHNGDDNISALTVDKEGNAIITGTSYERVITGDVMIFRVFDDIATIKYNSEGKEEWIVRYNGPDFGFDAGRALAIDDEGNIYMAGVTQAPIVVGGSTSRSGMFDPLLIKYGQNGQEMWRTRRYGSDSLYDSTRSVSIDSKGNVYVTVESHRVNYSAFSYTVKYNSDGKEEWLLDHETSLKLLAVDKKGNIYTLSSRKVSETKTDMVVVKYPAK